MDFDAVYTTYFAPVYRYVLALCRDEALAEEITADSFFAALKQIDRFRGESDIYTWLCRIAKNRLISHLRREKHRADGELLERLEAPETPVEQAVCDRETAMRVHEIVHGLDEPYKEVFNLRVFGELPYAAIGRLFGKSENWACVTYYRAKEKILRELNREES